MKLSPRTKSRQLALQILYQADVGVPVAPGGPFPLLEDTLTAPGVRDYARRLAAGVLERRAEIDSTLGRYARNWSVNRMPILDRNVMRIGVFELVFADETPPVVAIDEAVEMARRFGTAESGSFANGVLDRVREDRDSLRQEFKVAAGDSCSEKP